MLFPTIDFGLFFAFSFALVWGLNPYNTVKKVVLLALSLAFYASWNWRFLLLLLASGAISYVVGLYVDAAAQRPFRRLALGARRRARSRHPRLFQISRFLHRPGAERSRHMLGFDLPLGFVNVTLPVAISFLTFHAISYIVDVYRGRLPASRSPLDILLYVSFFPHLVAGPIVRAHEFLPQLASPRRAGDFSFGENMLLILGGLFKKMVIANYLAVRFVDPVFTDPIAILALRSDHGGLRLRDPDLRRLLRLHRHRHRRRGAARLSLSAEFQPALSRARHRRLLAALAHDAVERGCATISTSRSAATATARWRPRAT